jgi:cytochrome c
MSHILARRWTFTGSTLSARKTRWLNGSLTRRLAGAALTLVAAVTSAPGMAQEAGDAAAGQKVFNKCKSCHQVGETARNLVGPQLNGLLGRHSAALPDYRYSPALQKANLVWDAPGLQAFLKKPQAVVPGTKMSFAGISADKDLDNLLAYLGQFGPDGKTSP